MVKLLRDDSANGRVSRKLGLTPMVYDHISDSLQQCFSVATTDSSLVSAFSTFVPFMSEWNTPTTCPSQPPEEPVQIWRCHLVARSSPVVVWIDMLSVSQGSQSSAQFTHSLGISPWVPTPPLYSSQIEAFLSDSIHEPLCIFLLLSEMTSLSSLVLPEPLVFLKSAPSLNTRHVGYRVSWLSLLCRFTALPCAF